MFVFSDAQNTPGDMASSPAPACGFPRTSTSFNSPVQNSCWVSDFVICWDKMHTHLRRCLETRKRPKPSDRRHMLRIIADDIGKVCLNPPFKQCAELAKKIVDAYPESFEDRTDEGERLGNGYFTLGKQLRTRIEFLNRDNNLVRLRKSKKQKATETEEVEMETPNPKCARTDSYGCVAWQPQQLPQGETRESLLEKKRELLLIFSHEGTRAANQRRVAELMSETYISQRSDINGFPPPSVSDIQNNWPFLLMPSFLLQHFKTLTEIDLEKRLQEALKTKGKRLLNFFKSQLMKWSASVKTVLSSLEAQTDESINPGLASILVLMAQFKDQEDDIFLLADVGIAMSVFSWIMCHQYFVVVCNASCIFLLIFCCRKLQPKQMLKPR